VISPSYVPPCLYKHRPDLRFPPSPRQPSQSGNGIENAFTFSTRIASRVARAVTVLLRAVSLERLVSFKAAHI
jgi:hypothetical protein